MRNTPTIADCIANSQMTSEIREFLPEGDTTDGSLYLHVVEEVFQHLGHIDLSIDAILS